MYFIPLLLHQDSRDAYIRMAMEPTATTTIYTLSKKKEEEDLETDGRVHILGRPEFGEFSLHGL